MKSRLFTLGLLAICMVMIPLSHSAMSKKKAGKKNGPPVKVAICHFPDDQTVGHVIEISENAVAAHLAKHGDCVDFRARPNGACRCLTCTEQCRLDRARCEDACDDNPTCIRRCNAAADDCVRGCNRIGGGG